MTDLALTHPGKAVVTSTTLGIAIIVGIRLGIGVAQSVWPW